MRGEQSRKVDVVLKADQENGEGGMEVAPVHIFDMG